MRELRILMAGLFAFALLPRGEAQTPATNILGQWDFNSADLAAATVGSPLQFVGDIEGAFLTNEVAGAPAGLMRFPAATREQGFLATFNATPNGGGTNLNVYTILMDVMWPAESDFDWRGLFNASTNNQDDAEIFVSGDNQLGSFNDFVFDIEAETWHRLILVYNLTNNTVTRYLNGELAPGDPRPLEGGGVDSRYSLNDAVLFFTDNNDEAQPGFVNSLQVRSGEMTAAEAAALRGPSAAGLSEAGTPPIVGDIRIASITRNGNSVVIQMSDTRSVELQRKVRLNDPNWQPVQTSNTGTFTVPILEATGFFRALLK